VHARGEAKQLLVAVHGSDVGIRQRHLGCTATHRSRIYSMVEEALDLYEATGGPNLQHNLRTYGHSDAGQCAGQRAPFAGVTRPGVHLLPIETKLVSLQLCVPLRRQHR